MDSMENQQEVLFSSAIRTALGHFNNGQLYNGLRGYLIDPSFLFHYSFPVEMIGMSGFAVIKRPHPNVFDKANDTPSVPSNNKLLEESDSGRGSSVENSDEESEIVSKPLRRKSLLRQPEFENRQTCARCRALFSSDEKESCIHHWGKVRGGIWQCCYKELGSSGCAFAQSHVWSGLIPGFNGPLPGFVTTVPCTTYPKDGNYGIFALDCEMCYIKNGMQLARVSVVDIDGNLIYDTFVIPEEPVIDYNTRFSGILPDHLNQATKTIQDIQRDLFTFIFAETILIGHGLENDLKALRIIYSTVIDTSIIYPHRYGPPMRYSLKILAQSALKLRLHDGEHDSVEDARVASDLALTKFQNDLESGAIYFDGFVTYLA